MKQIERNLFGKWESDFNGEINHNSIGTKVLGLIWEKQKDNITFLFKYLVAWFIHVQQKDNF